jgi:PadR family transcriptional regulator PadR
MPPVDTLGQFEAWILTTVVTLGPRNAYGMTIHEEVEKLSGRKIVSLGAVYTTLDRLEAKGMVSSHFADPTPERGGRSKRYFRIEAAGQSALSHSIEQSTAMERALRGARRLA